MVKFSAELKPIDLQATFAFSNVNFLSHKVFHSFSSLSWSQLTINFAKNVFYLIKILPLEASSCIITSDFIWLRISTQKKIILTYSAFLNTSAWPLEIDKHKLCFSLYFKPWALVFAKNDENLKPEVLKIKLNSQASDEKSNPQAAVQPRTAFCHYVFLTAMTENISIAPHGRSSGREFRYHYHARTNYFH